MAEDRNAKNDDKKTIFSFINYWKLQKIYKEMFNNYCSIHINIES